MSLAVAVRRIHPTDTVRPACRAGSRTPLVLTAHTAPHRATSQTVRPPTTHPLPPWRLPAVRAHPADSADSAPTRPYPHTSRNSLLRTPPNQLDTSAR